MISKCEKCPIFTSSSLDRQNCEPLKIFEIKNYSYRFLLGGLGKIQTRECNSDNKICYNTFIGPIDNMKEKEIFYISYAKRDQIDISDFSYTTSKNKKDKAHIFYLKSSNISEKHNFEKHENLKNLLNVGNYIEYIRALPLMTHKENNREKTNGVYIKYSQGDTCLNDPQQNYTSYLFIICDKFSNENYPLYKMKTPDKCTFFFEWKTRYGCKSCNLDDTDKVYVKRFFFISIIIINIHNFLLFK